MDAERKNGIIREINSSGFPLEIATFRDLHEAGWVVSPNLHFNDGGGATHEIDALAFVSRQQDLPVGSVGMVAVVECKRSRDKPWVFFRQHHDPLGSISILEKVQVLSDINRKDGKPLNHASWNSPLAGHHYKDASLPSARTYFEAFRGERKDGEIFKAVKTLWHARVFAQRWFESERRPRRSGPRTWLLHPVVVFEGELLVADRTPEGEWDVTPTNHVLLRTIDCISANTLSPFPDNEVVIDVVSKDYFGTYLEKCDKAMDAVWAHLWNLQHASELDLPVLAG